MDPCSCGKKKFVVWTRFGRVSKVSERSSASHSLLSPSPHPTPFRVMILKGCQVVVKCGGDSMTEYEKTVSEDGKVVTCCIASQPGKVSAVQDINAQ